ncbi:MAG: hypothetical protein ACRYGR_07310 [Janthinobacterium lividum]
MEDKDKFMSGLENNLSRYERKISKASKAMQNYPESERESYNSEIENIKEKYKDAQKVFQDMKYATEDNWNTLKDSSGEVLKSLKEAFNEFSGYISLDQVNQVKEDVMDYGHEKLDDLSNCIKKKPISAALWAMGIGFVLGKILRSK